MIYRFDDCELDVGRVVLRRGPESGAGPYPSAARVERLVWLTKLAQGMLSMLLNRGELAAEDTKKMRV